MTKTFAIELKELEEARAALATAQQLVETKARSIIDGKLEAARVLLQEAAAMAESAELKISFKIDDDDVGLEYEQRYGWSTIDNHRDY